MISEQALDEHWPQHLKLNTIIMPTLLDRLDDLPSLIQHFLSDYYQKYGTTAIKIKEDALQLIQQKASHMSISQLKQLIKQAAMNETEYVLSAETLSRLLDGYSASRASQSIELTGTLKDIEKEIISYVLKEENNNQSKAAERLGINRATLWRKLKND